MFDIELARTQTERTGDSAHPFQFNRSQAHEERVKAHCERVQREYFDSGLYYKETHKAELIDD
jgi:hypothetical protein